MDKKLPDIHEQALMFKNSKRFQYDGGRAWIKDSQLHEARKDGNGRLQTIQRKKESERVAETEEHNPSL